MAVEFYSACEFPKYIGASNGVYIVHRHHAPLDPSLILKNIFCNPVSADLCWWSLVKLMDMRNEGKILPTQSMKTHRSGGKAPLIPNIDARRRYVVSLTPLPFYTQRNRCWYPSNRRLDGPPSRSGLIGGKSLGALGNRNADCSAMA